MFLFVQNDWSCVCLVIGLVQTHTLRTIFLQLHAKLKLLLEYSKSI